jgi:hypothetical protein
MAQAPPQTETKQTAEQQPPDERFWKYYSPHHELPVSATASIALHVLVLLALAGVLPFVPVSCWGGDKSPDGPSAPPRMEVVEIQGGQGGLDGLGFGNTPLGGGGGKDKAENVENLGNDQEKSPTKPPVDTKIEDIKDPLKAPEFQVPDRSKEQTHSSEGGEAFAQLDATVKKVEDDIIKATLPVPPPRPGGTKKVAGGEKGPGRVPGTGGPAGKGGGKGGNVGPGSGSSPYGKVLTNQTKRQMRWRILASEDGRIHLAKLKALGITLVVPTGKPNVFQIMDLSQPNPTFRLTDQLRNQGDKVWWTNRSPREVLGLATVLRISPPPPCFVIFLPKELEERMLVLEQEHQGASEELIHQTIWDVPLRNGRYASEPQVVQQILKGKR